MREMKDSGIEWLGTIPRNWHSDKVKYHFVVNKRIVGVEVDNYDRLALTLNGVVHRSKEDNEGLQPDKFDGYQIIKRNEIVFKLIDLKNISTSRVGLSKYEGIVSPAYIILSSNGDILPSFAEKYFLSMWHRNIFNSLGDSGVRSSLNSADLLNLSIVYPSIEEQERIANFLDEKCDEIDSLISDIQKQIDVLKEYKKTIIDKETLKGKQVRFKYIAEIKSNLVSPLIFKQYQQIGPDSIEKDTGKIIIHRTVEETTVDSWNHLFYEGQLIYSKIRPVLNKVAIAPYDGLCSADMYPIETKENTNYIKYAMLSSFFVNQVDMITKDRIKMPKINQNELSNILVNIPERHEQDIIANYLDDVCKEIDINIEKKHLQIEILLNYKKSIVFEYITGKKEVGHNV